MAFPKTKEVGGIACPRKCFAHAPSADPDTWYLPLYDGPDDDRVSLAKVASAVTTFLRCSNPRAESNLQRDHFPQVAAKLAEALAIVHPDKPMPPAIADLIPSSVMQGEKA